MAQPLLEGEYVDSAQPDPRIRSLEIENSDLKRKLQRAELAEQHAKESVALTLVELKRMTLPFLNLLKAVHGEIDRLGIADSGSPAPVAANANRWTTLMAKLGGNRAKFMQAILDFGPSTASQIRAATGITRMPTIYQAAHELMKLGVVVKKGEQYALKE